MNRKQRSQLQTEVDAAYLYRSLATLHKDASMRQVLEEMAAIEEQHVHHLLESLREEHPGLQAPGPGLRARLQVRAGRIFGYDHIIQQLTAIERNLASNAVDAAIREGGQPRGLEHTHLRIIEEVSGKSASAPDQGIMTRLEGRHRTVGGNALRAAVLGANDGLVSNSSLVMGVAGAAAANDTILLTGLAGLLAGAISMALGEWLSVQSSRELYQRQVKLEAEEIASSPELEKKELEIYFRAKGADEEASRKMADKAFESPQTALTALVQEELGFDKDEMSANPWEAAIASFVLFAVGAIIPVWPFFMMDGGRAILASVVSSVIGLFLIGASTSLFTGRSIAFAGIRQVIFGLAAAGVTYGVGHLIGVSISG